ncbi:MAG: hypothetical protein IOB84_10405 [Brevundimonas sp.]|nr:hypothetical protein [Brevundimonas sp.]
MPSLSHHSLAFSYGSLEEAFPHVDPGVQPFGPRVLVQLRSPKTRLKSGLIITAETRETEAYNTQVALVRAVGPLAFKARSDLTPWPEGAWASPGEYVRVPKYGGDRWELDLDPNDPDKKVLFVIFEDKDLIGKITGNPLDMKAFV